MTKREEQIIYMVLFAGRSESYFNDMTDEHVESEYRRLLNIGSIVDLK